MKAREIKPGIYWVGGIDWNLRNFHGYSTERGSTYNAYLVIDEKVALIDTVKGYLCDEMLSRISSIIDPSKIDFVVCNHVEMDHSGALPCVMKHAPNAKVYYSKRAEVGIKKHYNPTWDCTLVDTGDTLSLGKLTLEFLLTPMVHWPDSMATYCPEQNILFSNDAFGQHLASDERFDDERPYGIVIEEAAKYYANIVLSYSPQVQRYLQAAEKMNFNMIAPSHGLIWRKNIKEIIDLYTKWSHNECDEKAVIIYDTMLDSTAKMAFAIRDLFEERGMRFEMKNLTHDHISNVMTSLLDAKYICVGTSTLNNNMLPTVAGFLTYMKGLAPKNRIGLAFGSYGWSGESISQIEEVLETCKFEIPIKGLKIQYIPSVEELQDLQAKVRKALFSE